MGSVLAHRWIGGSWSSSGTAAGMAGQHPVGVSAAEPAWHGAECREEGTPGESLGNSSHSGRGP
eukprot:7848659-Alexandrium_andersonii.AAC.1